MKNIQIIEEELHAAIIAVVPEIIELTFGCRILHEGSDGSVDIVTEVALGTEDIQDSVYVVGDDKGYPINWIKKHCEIIGRPITIADVLRAMSNDSLIDITCEGEFIDNDLNEMARYTEVYWNLSQSLDGQSEETKRFLWSVICKK